MNVLILDAATLRHLAAALEDRDPELQARRRLGREGAEELADMLIAGRVPTVGWWKRHIGDAKGSR